MEFKDSSRDYPEFMTNNLFVTRKERAMEEFKMTVSKGLKNQSNKMKKDNRTCIASLFVPLIKYLRAIGFCPFIIKRDPHSPFVTYEFKLRSWLSAYNLSFSISFCLAGVAVFLYLLQVGFGLEFEEVLEFQGISSINGSMAQNRSFVSEFGSRIVPATLPLFAIVVSSGVLYTVTSLLPLLNNWSTFQMEYLHAFPLRKDDPFRDLRTFRNRNVMAYAAVSLIGVIVIAVVMQNCHSWRACIFPGNIWGPTLMGVITMMVIFGSHGIHFLTFRALAECFKQIRVGIQSSNERSGQNEHRKNQMENIKNWMKVVTCAKQQVCRTGKAVALHHVLMILINFIYLCLGVFSLFWSTRGSAEGSRGVMLLSFAAWGFTLLIVKAILCEDIAVEEKNLVAELRKVDFKEHLPSLIQLNSLIELINDNPAKIRFWNMFTLNKSFLLKLFGQVATYLIVLIQFDNIEKRKECRSADCSS